MVGAMKINLNLDPAQRTMQWEILDLLFPSGVTLFPPPPTATVHLKQLLVDGAGRRYKIRSKWLSKALGESTIPLL